MPFDADNPLAIEIQAEAAAAYFAACKKMVDALAALKAFDLSAASLAPETKTRSELLEDAAERVYFVVIQREALKLSGSEEFFEDYEVPAEVKTRMGARRKRMEE